MMRTLFSAALFCGLLLAGCSETETDNNSEIRIGMHTDLSGPAALVGVASVNGARMLFDEVNARGGVHGRQLRLIAEDSQYQVPRAVQAVNKLVKRDNVFAIMGSIGTPMNNAVRPMQFENNVPNLFPMTGARSMNEPFHRLQFALMDQYYSQVYHSVGYFLEKVENPVPCVIYQDTDFGEEILEGALDGLAAAGLEPAETSGHKPTDIEFTSAILRLRSAGCNLVFTGTIHKDTVLILQTALKLGWTDVQWVGSSASLSNAVAGMENGASEGYALFQSIPAISPEDEQASEFLKQWWDRYIDTYGVEPELAAMACYSAAGILVEALQRSGPEITVDGLIAGIESLDDYTDPFGVHHRFGPSDHYGPHTAYLTVVRDGKWITLPESFTF